MIVVATKDIQSCVHLDICLLRFISEVVGSCQVIPQIIALRCNGGKATKKEFYFGQDKGEASAEKLSHIIQPGRFQRRWRFPELGPDGL